MLNEGLWRVCQSPFFLVYLVCNERFLPAVEMTKGECRSDR